MCLTSTSAGVIISGGCDGVVKFWTKRGGEFLETLAFPQPKGLAVSSVGYYESPGGWRVFVGRNDGTIAVYGSGSAEPLTVLTQHSFNVCCLYVDEKNHILLSGSRDNSVIVWPISELESPGFSTLLLNGYKLPVRALAAIESSPGHYLSGSADKTIKLWQDDNEIRTFTGHTDVVRALLVISNDKFLSAANDSTIRLWHTETGVCIAKFSSLVDDFISSLALIDSHVISCTEGGYVEVWKQSTVDGQPSLSHTQLIQCPSHTQLILSPAWLTLWALRGLPNGGIACAVSDGKIYTFTQEKSRAAPESMAFTPTKAIAELKGALQRKEVEFLNLKCAYLSTRLTASSQSLKNTMLANEIALLNDKNEEMEETLETTKRRLQACELQLHEAKSLQSKLKADLLREREQLRISKKKENELGNYVKILERELRDLRGVKEKSLKNCLRPRNNATTYQCMEKSRENADSREELPKRKTRIPLLDRKNSQENANC